MTATTAGPLRIRSASASWLVPASAACATAVGVVTAVVVARISEDSVAFSERGWPLWATALGWVAPSFTFMGIWMLSGRRPHPTWGLSFAAIAALIPLWAAWPTLPAVVRAGALAFVPLVPIGLTWVGLDWSARPSLSRGTRIAFLIVGVAGLVHLLGYNPFADPGCARTCASVEPLLEGVLTTRASAILANVLSAIGTAWLLATIATMETTRSPLMIRVTIAMALLGHGTLTVVRSLAWGDASLTNTTYVLESMGVSIAGIGVCISTARSLRARSAVSRMVGHLSGPEFVSRISGGVENVHFAFADGQRWVDAEGKEVLLSPGEDRSVVLSQDSTPVIRFILARGAEPNEVLAGISAESRLALRNAQLSAIAKAQLYDIQASQRRVVAASDAERRRIERDLHDGAQQRLVGATFHLRAARAHADASTLALLQREDRRVHDALGSLRDLAHGMVPGVLVDEGLAPALKELVASSDVPASLKVSLRNEVDQERAMAAYLAVAGVLGQITRPMEDTHASISVDQRDERLRVQVMIDTCGAELGAIDLTEVGDRIGAVGGWVTLSESEEALTMRAEIPCES